MGRLFWKFFFAFWLALQLAGLGVGVMVWVYKSVQEEETEARISMRAAALVHASATVLQHAGTAGLETYLKQLPSPPLPSILVVDEQGRDFIGREVSMELVQAARAIRDTRFGRRAVQQVTLESGESWLLFAERRVMLSRTGAGPPPPPPGHRHGPRLPWLTIISSLLASLLFSAGMAWYFSRPIRSLRAACESMAAGDLQTRVGPEIGRRHDELADLGHDFDHMASQIGALVNAQQRLLHDVSHELRSPLARLQAAIGIAQQQPQRIDEVLGRLERDTQRISDLVGELLVLSRMEAGVAGGTVTEFDLDELLQDIVEDVRFEGDSRQVSVLYKGAGPVSMSGYQELIHRAVENVLRNALRFCRQGGEVRLQMEPQRYADGVSIAIIDQGPGVPEEKLESIFEPFIRAGRSPGDEGTGLGLAIARRAVHSQGGSIHARNPDGGGLEVMLHLPLRLKDTARGNGR